jgi:hypothetical protein
LAALHQRNIIHPINTIVHLATALCTTRRGPSEKSKLGGLKHYGNRSSQYIERDNSQRPSSIAYTARRALLDDVDEHKNHISKQQHAPDNLPKAYFATLDSCLLARVST